MAVVCGVYNICILHILFPIILTIFFPPRNGLVIHPYILSHVAQIRPISNARFIWYRCIRIRLMECHGLIFEWIRYIAVGIVYRPKP